ncbi:MAG TPA: hypothetical protein VLB84_12940 [Bacteroidia bacterium]|jgi:hypothetical protein|nr:hypothetical protein [Bacteroidia bacterium]
MNVFENISAAEKESLLKFPAYILLLAANSDGKLDKSEEEESIHFTHIKTFSCDPLLSTFYKEADKVFKTNVENLNKLLPKDKKEREQKIKTALENLEPILKKLGEEYTSTMHKSMKAYAQHVSNAHDSIALQFLLPVYIKGLSD